MKSSVSKRVFTSSGLECYYFNATSIKGKLQEFNSHFSGNDYDIIAVTETWLDDSVFDGEILQNCRYQIFRRDRCSENSIKSTGGGVMVAVNETLNAKLRVDLNTAIEIIWVEIYLSKNKSLFVASLYLPDYASSDTLTLLENSLDKVRYQMRVDDSMLILGDCNRRDVLWSDVNTEYSPSTVTNSNACPLSRNFLEITDSHSLAQFNSFPTCNGNVLDLVLAHNTSVSVKKAEKATTSTHEALEVNLRLPCEQSTMKIERKVYNFKKADFDVVHRLLACLSWCNLLHFKTTSDALSYFYDIILAVIADSIPTVKARSRDFPYWYDGELISLVLEKERLSQKFKRTGCNKNSTEYARFSELRRDIKRKQRTRHKEYIVDLGDEIKSNPKRFWSYMKNIKVTKSLPNKMFLKSCPYESCDSIAKGFNDFFQTVFKTDATEVPYCKYRETPLFHMDTISPNEMKECLQSLSPHTCSGYDNIPATFLIKCANQLCYPLSCIINMSITRGEYPSLLKFNNVIPIYKNKGERNDIESYRGISIQPILAKVFESIVNKRLRCHMKNLISDHQHGFQPKKSTFTNLAVYHDFITESIDSKLDVHAVYTDFSKAFDVVSHNLLLLKLERRFGIQNNMLAWFKSYLRDRHQRVVINGLASEWIDVTSGVPQGSILGPIMFLAFVDDLPEECQHSECKLFADDGKIYRAISCILDCILLQADLDRIYQWCCTWKMSLNISKCSYICFSNKIKHSISYNYCFNNVIIERVFHIKDLGVYFSSNLNFQYHVDHVVSKANKMLGFIRRTTKDINNVTVLKSLFRSLVLSKLEYCSSIWSPSQLFLSLKIERVQKRAIKWLAFKSSTPYRDVSYIDLCERFQLSTLDVRRKQLDLRNFNKILCSHINCPYLLSKVNFYIPRRCVRSPFTFYSPARIKVRRDSFLPRTHALINSLPSNVDIYECNPVAFKHVVKEIEF